jgi:hypothetical protein
MNKQIAAARLILCAAFLLCRCAHAAGTWTSLAHTAPAGVNTMLLLSDGTVMAASSTGGNGSANWYRLTPDIHGSYVNGTWTTLASMVDSRLYYASQVLTNGRVFVAGGEYGTGKCSGEVYDPLLNAWSFCPGSAQSFSDNISETLPSGNVLVSPVGPSTYGGTIVYNAGANSWTNGPTLYRGYYQDEASWVKLSDGSILTIDSFGTNTERYIPSLNQWVNDAGVPVPLYDPYGDELGPGFLLPNGKAIFFGSMPNTAIYTPSGTTNPGAWTAGPAYPNNQGMPDAPGAMMVSGTILLSTSPTPTSADHFPSPMSFYEYNYTVGTTGAFTAVGFPAGLSANSDSTYYSRMLALPDGTVLYNLSGSQLYDYQPSGPPLAAGQPAILSLTTNFYGSYHLTGTLFNGISEGAAYGDDAQMNSDYPLVRMTNNTSGYVYYARTYNWNNTGPMTSNKVVATEFMVPASLPAGTYSLVVVANGNSSAPVTFVWAPDALQISPLAGFASAGTTNAAFTPSSQTYTFTNLGPSVLSWVLANPANWLSVSPTNGTLSPGGGSASVTVSVNTNANTLAPGTYTATLTFTNLASGAIQSLPYRLQVNPLVMNGGFDYATLAYWTFASGRSALAVASSENSGDVPYVRSGYNAAKLGGTNVTGSLSQSLPTTAGQSYVLSFWLANPASPAGSNIFSALWNGATVYAITNLPASGFTNVLVEVSASGSRSALQFNYLNLSNYFALDDVSLTPSLGGVPTNGPGTPIALSGFNRDVVVESTAAGGNTAPYGQAFDVAHAYALFEAGLPADNYSGGNPTVEGLPASGSITSILDGVTVFQLQPYTASNVLFLTPSAPTGTLTLTTPAAYASLSVLATSANGGGGGTFVLQFTDGTSSGPMTFSAPDWFNNLDAACTHFGRIDCGNLGVFDTDNPSANNPNLYQTTVNLAAKGLQTRKISSLTFTMLTGGDATASTCTGVFAVSGAATQPPAILTQPQSLTNWLGATASFSVTASETVPFACQWQHAGTNLAGNGHYYGAQSNVLAIAGLLAGDAGAYRAILTNIAGAATSSVANLTVLMPMIEQAALNSNGNVTLSLSTLPNSSSRVLVATNLSPPIVWHPLYTNLAPASGLWQFTDTNTAAFPARFYRTSTP